MVHAERPAVPGASSVLPFLLSQLPCRISARWSPWPHERRRCGHRPMLELAKALALPAPAQRRSSLPSPSAFAALSRSGGHRLATITLPPFPVLASLLSYA